MRSRTVIVEVIGRRAVRSGLIWGTFFGIYVATAASGYAAAYPTSASRLKLALSLSANTGLAAIIGPARHLDTVAGFTAWRTLGGLSIIGSIWGLLAGTRLVRGEEDAGRVDLLLAGQSTRRGAAGQCVAGLAAGWVTLWSVTASIVVLDGWSAKVNFSAASSIFLSIAVTTGAAVFLAVGAVASQLAPTRRQANLVGGGVLAASFAVRMVADSAASATWLRWVSPLGWPELMRPLTGSDPAPVVVVGVFLALAAGTAVWLAGRRDAGAGILAASDEGPTHNRLLRGPLGLGVLLVRGVGTAWIVALAMFGLIFGLIAQSAADAASGSATMERVLARLGGHRGGAATYLGATFLFAAALMAFIAAGQLAAARAEESEGHLDHLLARPVSRARWLLGRLLVAVAVLCIAGPAAGGLAWIGALSQHSDVRLTDLAAAGINIVPPAVFVLGIGALVFGTTPRWAPPVAYVIVAWSFLVEIVASSVRVNRWIIDTSVLHHIAPAPAAPPNWASAATLVGLGAAAAAAGVVAFTRRDVVGA